MMMREKKTKMMAAQYPYKKCVVVQRKGCQKDIQVHDLDSSAGNTRLRQSSSPKAPSQHDPNSLELELVRSPPVWSERDKQTNQGELSKSSLDHKNKQTKWAGFLFNFYLEFWLNHSQRVKVFTGT
mmetsp:Transcript_13086/g.40304  ORF Transcript_13086/g.40304 Transcript_13086/m.40304 type:complete len:126 (+) Transcript_13086:1740-2117(+)